MNYFRCVSHSLHHAPSQCDIFFYVSIYSNGSSSMVWRVPCFAQGGSSILSVVRITNSFTYSCSLSVSSHFNRVTGDVNLTVIGGECGQSSLNTSFLLIPP
jgi:hypothetical protein